MYTSEKNKLNYNADEHGASLRVDLYTTKLLTNSAITIMFVRNSTYILWESTAE